jgi:hypothetical protein
MNLRLIKGIDLLALPLIKEGLRFGIKVRSGAGAGRQETTSQSATQVRQC